MKRRLAHTSISSQRRLKEMKEAYHKCLLCQTTFKNEPDLFLHLLSLVHQKKLGAEHDTDEDFFFQCALCSEDFPNLKKFIVHVRGVPHIEKLKIFQSNEDQIEIHQMLMKIQDTFLKESKKPTIMPQNVRLIDPDKGSGIKKTSTDLHHITEARRSLIKASCEKVEITAPGSDLQLSSQPHLNHSRNSHPGSTPRLPTEVDPTSYHRPYHRPYSNLDPRPYFDPKSHPQFASKPYSESDFRTYSRFVPRPHFPRHQLRHSHKPRFRSNPRFRSPHSKDFFRNHSPRPKNPRNFNGSWNRSFRFYDSGINQRFQSHQDFVNSNQINDHLSSSCSSEKTLNGNHVTSYKDDDVIRETHKHHSPKSFNDSLMKQKNLTEELRSFRQSLNEDLEVETRRSSSSHKSEVANIEYQTPPSRARSEDTFSDVAPRIVLLDEIDPINGTNSSTTSEERSPKESKVNEKQRLGRDGNKSLNNSGSSSSSVNEKATGKNKQNNCQSTKSTHRYHTLKYKGRSKKRKCFQSANSSLQENPASVKDQLQQLACDKQAQQDTVKQLERNNNDKIEEQHPDKNESCFKEPLPPARFEIEELFVPIMTPSQSTKCKQDVEEFLKIVQQVEKESDQTPNLCSSREAPLEPTSQSSSSDLHEKLLKMSEEEDGLMKDLDSLKKQSVALQTEVTEVEAKLKSLMQKQADVSEDVKNKEVRLKLIHEKRLQLLRNTSSKSCSQVDSFGADDKSSESPITSRSSDQILQSPRSSDQILQSPRSSDQILQSPRSSDQLSYSSRSLDQKKQSPRSLDQKNQSSNSSDQLSYSSRSFESASQNHSTCSKIQTNLPPDVKLSPDSIVSKYLTDQQQEIIRKNNEQIMAKIKEEKVNLEESAFPVPVSSGVSSTDSWHSVVNSSFSSCSSRKYKEETEFFKLLYHEKRKAESLDMSLQIHKLPVIYVDVVMNRYLISSSKDLKIVITDLGKKSEVGKMKLCSAPSCAVTWEKIIERERIEVSMYVAVNTSTDLTWKNAKHKVYCIKACITHKTNNVCNVSWKHKLVVDANIPITCLLPKKQLLYIGKKNGDIVVYDTDKNRARTVFTYSTGHAVTALAFGRDGGREVIVCATSDHLINLRTADDGLMLKTFQCHSGTIQSIKVKDSVMVSASLDFTAQVHDVVSGRTKFKYMKQHRNCVKSLEIYKDRFVTVCKDNKLRVFSTNKLEMFGDPVEINAVPCSLFVDQCELLDFVLPVAYVGCENGFVKILGIHELANLSLSQKMRRTGEHNHSSSETSNTSSFDKMIDYVHSFNCQWSDCEAGGFSNGDALKTHIYLFHVTDEFVKRMNTSCCWGKCVHYFSTDIDTKENVYLHIEEHLNDLIKYSFK